MRRKIKKIPEINKNYGWFLFFVVFLWMIVGGVIFGLDPKTLADVPLTGSFLIMGVLLFVTFFLTLSLLFLSAKSGLWWSGGIVLFLYLRLWGLGSFINGLLILGILLCVEIYFRQMKKKGLQK